MKARRKKRAPVRKKPAKRKPSKKTVKRKSPQRRKPPLSRRIVRARIRRIERRYDADDLDWREFQSLLLSEGLTLRDLRGAGTGSVRIIEKYGASIVRPIQRLVIGQSAEQIAETLSQDDFLAKIQAAGMTYREVYTLGISP